MNRISKLYLSAGGVANVASQAAREMPDLRRAPIVDALIEIMDPSRGRRFHEVMDEQHRRHGPVLRCRAGVIDAVFVSSAEAVRELFRLEGPTPRHFVPEAWLHYNRIHERKRGLLFMDGQEWLHYRRILNKIMLAKDSVTMMRKPCKEAATNLIEKWNEYTKKDGIVPNLESQLYQWSIEVLLATLVGEAWPAYRRKILKELEQLSRTLVLIFEHSVYLSRMPPRFAQLVRLPSWTGFVATADYALDAVSQLVEEMAQLEGAEEALLGQMIEGGIEGPILQRIVTDLILAAGDTTAYSMQWLLHAMACNPDAQARLRKSLRDVEESELLHHPLLKGSIKESLRLYPTASFLTRILPQDASLDGYAAYKGELVVVSLFTCGRDKVNFPEPESFLPERWLRNEKGEFAGVTNPHATLPFAMGARSCIGRKLAEVQMSLTISEILRNFDIDCLNKNSIKMRLRLISAPSEPLQLQLTFRS